MLILGAALLGSGASAGDAPTGRPADARAFGIGLGVNIGGTVKVRPSLGWSFNSWSGSQKVEDSSSGPLLGLDVGPELRVSPRLSLSTEAVFRYTGIEIEENVRGGVTGAQVVVSWRGSGR